MEKQYTWRNITNRFGQTYLKQNPDEQNILADAI